MLTERPRRSRALLLVLLALALAVPLALGVYRATAPTYCPIFGGLIWPAERVCVQPDFLRNSYRYPAGHQLHTREGNLVDAVPVGTDIGPGPASFWYPALVPFFALAIWLLLWGVAWVRRRA